MPTVHNTACSTSGTCAKINVVDNTEIMVVHLIWQFGDRAPNCQIKNRQYFATYRYVIFNFYEITCTYSGVLQADRIEDRINQVSF